MSDVENTNRLHEDWQRFYEIVLRDVELQKKLRGTDGLDHFISLVVQCGAERGFNFSAEQVQASLRENRRAWMERWV
ncbi:MAG: hypothetical protein JWM68_2565 [Verrucomicrobiales bacterium]|nr:hypothetical protein [Verrucomicrobiales bacterium]